MSALAIVVVDAIIGGCELQESSFPFPVERMARTGNEIFQAQRNTALATEDHAHRMGSKCAKLRESIRCGFLLRCVRKGHSMRSQASHVCMKRGEQAGCCDHCATHGQARLHSSGRVDVTMLSRGSAL